MITDIEADRLADEYPNASPERKPQIETALRTWVTAAEAEAADRAREGAARLRQSFKSVSDLGGLWTKEQELRLPPTDNPDEVKARVANTAFLAEAGGMDYDTAAKTYEGLRARWAQATLGKKDAGDLEMYFEVSRQYQDGEDKAKLAFQRDADAASRGFQRALENAPPDWSTPESEWRKGAEKAPGFDANWGFGLEQSVAYRDAFQRAFKVATEHRPLVLETLDTLKRGTKWINQGAGLSEEAAARLMELPDAERADVLRAIVAGAASMSPEDPGAAVSNLQKVFKNMGISASRGLDALRLSKVSQALSAADAASALEAIKDGKPVYDLGGGRITPSLTAVQGAFGLEVSMQAADPVPASEIPALTKKLEGTLKFYQITNQLEQVSRQYLDPIRPAYKTGIGWVGETMAVGLAGSAPQMVAGTIPGVGLPWMTASFVDSAYERIVADQPDIDPRSALAMATVAGTIEGGIEMLQIRNAVGLLPATSKLVQALRTPNVNLFKELGIQLGKNVLEQNVEEALQYLALPVVKSIGAALNKDIDGVTWAQEWQEFGGTRLETFLGVLPWTIFGAGAAGIRETTAFRNLLASEQSLVEYGLPREVAANIVAQETPEARQAVFFEEQSKRTPESIRAGIAEAEARVARETVAATSNETPTMVYEGGKFRIVEPDGSSSMAFDDPETASLALQSRNEWEETGAAVAVRELADWLGMRDSDKRKWEVVPKIVTLEDDKLATPEQIAERMQLAGLEGLAPSEAQVFGQNVTEVRDGMVRVVNSVFIDSNPFDVIEEEVHFRFRQERDAGIITREEAEAAVRSFQGEKAPQTFSDQALEEAVAEMGRAYFGGNFRFIQNVPQSVRSFFLRMAKFFRETFRNAAKLKRLIREGKIDANWVAFLNRSVGLTEAVQEQEAAAKAAQDLTGQPAEIVTRFSIGARQVSETDRKYLDAVDRGDMETAQKMVDEAAKAAGYNVGPVWHYGAKGITEFRPFAREFMSGDKTAEQVDAFIRRAKERQMIGTMDFRAGTFFTPQRGSYSSYGPQEYGVYLKVDNAAKLINGDRWKTEVPGKPFDAIMMDMDGDGVVKEIAIIDPSKIKSADPVTRDDAGNIIPLSQRFNPDTPDIRFSVGRKVAPYAEQLAAQMDALKTKPTVRIQIYERAKKKFRELVERNRAAIAEAQAADTRKPADIIEEAKATHDAEVARIDAERDAALAAATTDKQRNTARLVHGTKLRAANLALSKALAAATGEGTRQARTAQVVGELNAILSAFPAEVRGRVGGFVQLVQRKTEKAFGKILSERIAKADAELERLLKREYIERIDSTLERLEPKLSEGKVQSSNLGHDAQAYVDAVAAVVNMSEDEVADEIARLEGLIDRETEPDKLAALVTRLEIANQYGNLEERTSAELASALENLQTVARGGREKWKIQEEARKEANKSTATKILDRLGFKNGRKPQDSDLQNAKERAKTFAEGAIDFVESNLSWPQTLQEVFKSAKDEVALYFEDLARKSTNALTDSLVKVGNRFNSEMNSRLGVKNRRERLKVLARLSETKNTGVDFLEGRVVVQEKIDIETARRLVAGGPVLGEFTLEEIKLVGNLLAENDAKPSRRQKKSLTFDRVLSEGEATPQRMTELEAVQYLLSWAQPDIRPRMERQGIGQNAIDGLEGFISKDARAIMGFLQEEYARGYTRLNEVYRRLFGMNMPRVENYSPARYDVAGADTDMGGPLDMGGGEGAGMSSGFVKTRQKHNARLARVDALSTYFRHVQNSEYWMAWAENVREMKATLGRTEVLQAIRSTAGLGKEEAVQKWVKAFETNGRKDASMFSVVTKLLNSVMAAHSKIALAWKVAVLMKQASAALGSTMEIPPGAAVSGWGRFMTGQLVIGLKDVWNSPTIQRRIESGFSPEVRTAMAADGLSPSMLASLGEKGMLPIVYTDAAFTTISAAIAYDYHYRKAVDSGVSPEAAKEVAMDAMDRTIHRTAQPAENVDRSLNEVNASVWAKLFMQFKSEARKNFAISYLAAKRIGRGEDVAANAKTLAVSWALGGVLTQTMGDLYRSIFKDDDDEDLWQPEDYMRAMVLGPIDGLFLIGPAVNGFLTWLTGGKVFQGKPANPVEQAIGDMRRKGANPANWEGWTDVYSGMLLWIQTVARLTGSKTMSGVGALGNAGKTLVELAEE